MLSKVTNRRCDHEANIEIAIEACSSIIQTDRDRHKLAAAYFNRAGWHLKKGEVNLAASELTEAIRLEPDFAAATKGNVRLPVRTLGHETRL